jgi:hypothetical protein
MHANFSAVIYVNFPISNYFFFLISFKAYVLLLQDTNMPHTWSAYSNEKFIVRALSFL